MIDGKNEGTGQEPVLHPELVDENGRPVAGGMTVSQAATYLGVSAADVRRYIRLGRLPAQRFIGLLGSEYRVATADVENLRGHLDVADEASAAPATGDDAADLIERAARAPTDSLLPDMRGELAALQQELAILHQKMADFERLSAEREAALRSELRDALQGYITGPAPATAQRAESPTPASPERRPWWWVLRRKQDRP